MANKKKSARKNQSSRKQSAQVISVPSGGVPNAAAPAPRDGGAGRVVAAPRSAAAPSRPVSGARRAINAPVAVSRETIAQVQATFANEYRYVITDLKRIGILAAVMFVLLVALALIFR